MPNYMLGIRYDNMDISNTTPEEWGKLISSVQEWGSKFEEKIVFSAKLLNDEGTTVSLKNGEYFIDGPFCETKEALAGFFVINVPTKVDAEEIAKAYPLLTGGQSVEVRSVDHAAEMKD